jgi:hypothetical protein
MKIKELCPEIIAANGGDLEMGAYEAETLRLLRQIEINTRK